MQVVYPQWRRTIVIDESVEEQLPVVSTSPWWKNQVSRTIQLGQTYGKLTVIRYGSKSRSYWCECACGLSCQLVMAYSLRRTTGAKLQCRACRYSVEKRFRLDLEKRTKRAQRTPVIQPGDRFGLLTAVKPGYLRSGPNSSHWCSCDCGQLSVLVINTNLRSGATRSCGCLTGRPGRNAIGSMAGRGGRHLVDMKGQRIGHWRVIRPGPTLRSGAQWWCICRCGQVCKLFRRAHLLDKRAALVCPACGRRTRHER